MVIVADGARAQQESSPKEPAPQPQLDALVEQAKQAQAQGKLTEALAAVSRIIALESAERGAESADVGDSYGWLADLQEAVDDFAAAEKSRQRALEILTQAFGKEDYRAIDARWRLATSRRIAQLDAQSRRAFAKAGELDRRAQQAYQRGRYADAFPLAQEALQIIGKTLGTESPRYASGLNILAILDQRRGGYVQSEQRFQESLAITKKTLGENHPEYAIVLNNLAHLYLQKGDYARAKPLFQQALAVKKTVFGERHSAYATGLNNLAVLYQTLGDYDAAEPLLQEALAIKKALVGENHLEYAASLGNLGTLYGFRSEYSRALPLFEEALAITKKAQGEEHPDYALRLNNLAALYREMGLYDRGVPLCRQALSITKKASGEQHPDYAWSLYNLAEFYGAMGESARAEPLYQQALGITKMTLGAGHPGYARCLIGLARLYDAMGDSDRAESLYQQGAEVQQRALGAEHPEYAETLRALASLYQSTDDYARAEPLQQRALAIQQKAVGENSPLYARGLNNLADIYRHAGDYARAEPLYLQALAVARKTLGEDHPDCEIHLADLAILYQLKGEPQRAEPLLQQALSITKKAMGQEHPDYAAELNNLAQLYLQTGDYARAEPLARDAFNILRRHSEQTIPALSEAQAMALLNRDPGADLWLSIARQLPATDPLLAWSQSWRSRGLITATERQRHLAALAAPEAAPLVADLRATQQQLAQIMLAAPQPSQRATQQQRLAELNDAKETLEKRLADASADFRVGQRLDAAGPDQLLDRLPAGTVVVDLVRIQYHHRQTQPGEPDRVHIEAHYEAFVVRGRERTEARGASATQDSPAVAWVHLGPALPIDEAAIAWREALLERDPPSDDEDAPESVLRRLVWAPLEKHFGGGRTVIVVPDGPLAVLPWCALPGARPGSFLVDDYQITLASHGRQLIQLLEERPEYQENLVLVGGVDYDHRPTDAAPAQVPEAPAIPPRAPVEPVGTPALDRTRQGRWKFLAGSQAETQQVARLWQRPGTVTPLSAAEASESALRAAAESARHLHLATHGFFADPIYHSMYEHASAAERLFGSFAAAQHGNVAVRNPLLLTGVVLSGANLPPATDDLGLPTGDDGILTAEEVVHLDLRGTELIVLSACETGLGKIGGGGEGVFGLQRAFHLAGSRNVIGTLWRVDDAATMSLMTEFYSGLWRRGLSPAAALRRAQLKMLAAYDPETGRLRDGVALDESDPAALTRARTEALRDPGRTLPPPYFWAAFSFSGDWR